MRYLLLFLLVLGLGCGSAPPPYRADDVRYSKESAIKRIHVIKGHEFDLTLADDSRVHLFLTCETVEDARSAVIKFLNNSTLPEVQVYGGDNYNIVGDLLVQPENATNKVSLTAWLSENHLVWTTLSNIKK